MKKMTFIFLFVFSVFTAFSQCNPYAGLDQVTCDQTTQLDADTIGMNIISLNWTSDISGVYISNAHIPNPEVSIASMVPSIYGDSGQVTVWFYLSTTCTSGSGLDSVSVTFYQNPIADAGSNYWPGLFGAGSKIKTDTACGYDYFLYAQPSIGVGTWYTTDQVNTWFLNPISDSTNNPYDTVHTSILTYNQPNHYKDFVWEENNNGCTDQDTLRLFFAPIPTGNFTVTQPWCIGYPSTVIANTAVNNQSLDWRLEHFYWGLDNGIVDTTGGIPPTGIDEDTLYVHWEDGSTMHNLSLLTINQYGCMSHINFDTVVEPPKMNPDYDIEDGTCGFANGMVTLYTNHHELTFTWDSTFICPNDTTQQGLLGDQTFTVLVHGQSVSPDAPQGTICTDTISIYLPDTGYTTALFDTMIPNGDLPYSIQLTNLSTNGNDFQWYVYDESDTSLVWSSSDENPVLNINQVGCYQIVLVSISPDDCRDTLQWGDFCVYNTGIESEHQKMLQIYPNPTKDMVMIDLNDLHASDATVEVFNMLGKKVNVKTETDINKIFMDMSNQNSGIYFVKITIGNNTFTEKMSLIK